MKEFTNEEKDKLLLLHKWEKVTGYSMDYESPECSNVIISVEEIKKLIGKPATDYYWEEDMEYSYDLEDAWEYFIDGLYNTLDTDDDNKIEEYLKNKLKDEVKE